jgi:hypothetical protein
MSYDPRRNPRVTTCSSGGGITGPIEVTGTVDIGNTVSITGSVTGTVDIGNTVPVTVSGDVALNLANATGDAFGRLRVSNPYTLFEFNSILGKGDSGEGQAIIDESTTGSGTSTWMPESYVKMAVNGTGTVIRQSHEYIVYQPGKSKLVMTTGVMYHTDAPNTTTNLISRMGAFDASMGIFLEYSADTMYIVKRNTAGDTKIARASWNLDSLDGTGACPSNVLFDKAQIFVIDFEWLGVGRVRCGIVVGGSLYYFHEFTHVSELDYPYIRTAKLPLRYEIRGGTGTVNSMHMICGTVISEGGFSPLTRSFWYPKAQQTDFINMNPPPTGTFVPFITLRIRDAFPQRYGTIKIKNVDIFNTSASEYGAWQLVLGGSLSAGTTGSFSVYDSASSIVDVNAGYNDTSRWSGGKVLASNFYATRTNSIQFTSTDELIQAPAICFNNLSGVSDTITLLTNSLTGGTNNVYYSLNWIEII